MENSQEIEKIFKEEIREKKSANAKFCGGVSKKKPKKIIYPMDVGSGKERSSYRRSGPCFVYRLEGSVDKVKEKIGYYDLALIDDLEEAKRVYKENFAQHTAKELMEMWGVSEWSIIKLKKALGVKRGKNNMIRFVEDTKWPMRNKDGSRVGEGNEEHVRVENTDMNKDIDIGEERGVGEIDKKGNTEIKSFSIQMEGIFTAEELDNRIRALENVPNINRDSMYKMVVLIEEIKQ